MKGELMSAGQQTTEFVWKWWMMWSASGAQYSNWGGERGKEKKNYLKNAKPQSNPHFSAYIKIDASSHHVKHNIYCASEIRLHGPFFGLKQFELELRKKS